MPIAINGTGTITGVSATGISSVQNLPATGTITNLTTTTISDGTNSTSSTNVIQGSAKAWVNYNGVSQSIRSSFNVSSVTYNSTGNYTVNFATAMPNTNYASLVYATADGGGSTRQGTIISVSTSSFRFESVDGNGNPANWIYENVAIFSL